jgi:hypothetical protein
MAEELFEDTGAALGKFVTTDQIDKDGKPIVPIVSPNSHEEEEPGKVPESFDDMDTDHEPRQSTSDAEAKLKVADYIVRPKGKFNLRQMSRVSPQDEKVLILLELQTEAHRLLTGSAKDEDGEPLLAGDMALDILARYSRARDGGLIVDALKVIQIEGEKEDEGNKTHWG